MFGILRYVLASMVVTYHLWPALTDWTGFYAVFGFFVLSGYLMTLVLNETYEYSFGGTARFFINRILRIYPPYLVSILISLCVLVAIPDCVYINRFFYLPQNIIEWLRNIFVFGLAPTELKPLLVGTAWSLTVELFYYAAMALFLARWRGLVFLWFLLSLGYTIYLVQTEPVFIYRYFSIAAGSLPFSIGAMIYHLRGWLKKLTSWHVLPASLFFAVNAVFARQIWDDPNTEGFYVSLALSTYLIISLCTVDKAIVPSWILKLDSRLGDLSYPIFLVHQSLYLVVMAIMDKTPDDYDIGTFIVSLAVINVLAFLINIGIEKPVNKIRNSIRLRESGPKVLGDGTFAVNESGV